jgi:hypothetical protein
MSELVTIHVLNQQDSPLEACQCFIYTEEGVLVTSSDTNEVGRAEVLLPSSPDLGIFYYVRLYKEGCSFDHKYGISVITDDNNTFDIVGIQHFFAPATDPTLCAIHFDPIFQAGSVAEISLHVLPVDIKTNGTSLVSRSTQISLDRRASFQLPRRAWFMTTLQDEVRVCYVPDLPACHIVDFLYPTVHSISITGDTSSLECDTYPKHFSFPVAIERTDGWVLPDLKNTLRIQDYVSIASSDPSVCSARITDTAISFVCQKAGTVTVTIESLPTIKNTFVGRDFYMDFELVVSDA